MTLSLLGKGGINDLTVPGDQVQGAGSVPGAVLMSSDGVRTWTPGAGSDALTDSEHLPDTGGVLAATADGLFSSQDDGASCQQLSCQQVSPELPRTMLEVGSSAGPVAVDADDDGRVWQLTGERWVELGDLGGPPAAFTAARAGTLLAATNEAPRCSREGSMRDVVAHLRSASR